MRRHHQVTDITVFGDFDIAHVGGEQRRHAGTADPGNEEHVVRDLLQGLQELGVIDIALAFPVHADQQAIGTGEDPTELEKVEHVGMPHRDLLVKPRVQPDMGGAVAQPQRDQQEQSQQQLAACHQLFGTAVDKTLHGGEMKRAGRHGLAPSMITAQPHTADEKTHAFILAIPHILLVLGSGCGGQPA